MNSTNIGFSKSLDKNYMYYIITIVVFNSTRQYTVEAAYVITDTVINRFIYFQLDKGPSTLYAVI